VVVVARGSLASNQGPLMELRVNGVAVGRAEVRSSSFARYVFNVSSAIPASAKVDVVFTNDAYINGQDRNLWVDSLELLGSTLRPTDKGVTYDRDNIDGKDVIAGQSAMPWAGALRFTVPGVQTSTVIVNARADLAGNQGAMMVLRVNGVVVGGTEVRSTGFTPYTFNVNAIKAGAHVDIAFTNDAVVNGADRNLFVQSLIIDGSKLLPTAKGVTYQVDGSRVLAGQEAMPWNGVLQFVAPDATQTTPVQTSNDPVVTTQPQPDPDPIPPVVTTKTGVASPDDVSGKTLSGAITAQNGQVIENLHITNPSGPCIVVPSGVNNVVIRNNEIGPCGSGVEGLGVRIDPNAFNITVQRNVIHDISSGVYAAGAKHPLIVDRNFVYNVHGPMPRGQMVQFNAVSGGSGQSRVTCNVSDKNYGNGTKAYEDHINMFRTFGSAGAPIEIARNRIRGGSSMSGSGIMMGDYGGAYIWVHDNVLTLTANTGIGIAGGQNMTVENNRIFNNGLSADTLTGRVLTMSNYAPEIGACQGHRITGNHGISRAWVWGGTGDLNEGFWESGMCNGNTIQNNNWTDNSLSASDFDQSISGCD
jgi:hypothetical protein